MSRVAAIYVCPVPAHGEEHLHLAYRFVGTWLQNEPLYDNHKLIVVANGGKPTPDMEVLFSNIPTFSGFYQHDDSGWDIGAYQAVSKVIDNEIVMFFGGNAYFNRKGWMGRMMQAYDFHGGHLYGAFASTICRPHIRTTGFWLPRELFNAYPFQIITHDQRYDFEHRTSNNITEWVETVGRRPIMVTWSGEWNRQHWGLVPNSFGMGDQSECLMRDKISDLMRPPA